MASLIRIFEAGTTSDANLREHVVDGRGQVSSWLADSADGNGLRSLSPELYWRTLESANPAYDVTEKKSLEGWALEKSFKSVKGVVVDASELRPLDEMRSTRSG